VKWILVWDGGCGGGGGVGGGGGWGGGVGQIQHLLIRPLCFWACQFFVDSTHPSHAPF